MFCTRHRFETEAKGNLKIAEIHGAQGTVGFLFVIVLFVC